ncbi:hypothetical protein ACJMK2_029740 [Sinanodonta woodiana]|uniref:Uncharacterized protein n=1 Tax=Sinanodonta woodiana TaxID=1069815 RepID=A0ABD3XF47_SINWO
MGIVGGLKASGILAKVSLIILFISSVCVLISISAVGWATKGNYRLGLWQSCPSDEMIVMATPAPNCTNFAGLAVDWWASVAAMTVLGTVGTLLAWLTCMTYMFHQRFMGNSECAYVSAILAILAGLCILVALIVFGVKFSSNSNYWLHYCFYLLIAPCFLDILAGILLFINIRKSSATSPFA